MMTSMSASWQPKDRPAPALPASSKPAARRRNAAGPERAPARVGRFRRRIFFGSFACALAFAVLSLALLSRPRPSPPPSPCPRPSILVRKAQAVVELSCAGELRGRYTATFGRSPVGPKLREGDERTPEGSYHIWSRVETPRFHRFLGVSYPNDADQKRARELGITRLGGGIGIHGVERSKAELARVWLRLGSTLGLTQLWGPTDGCIAVSNEDIEALYRVVEVGTPVSIVP